MTLTAEEGALGWQPPAAVPSFLLLGAVAMNPRTALSQQARGSWTVQADRAGTVFV